MIPFFTSEWTTSLKNALNHDSRFKELGAGWEGDLLFIITPDDAFTHEVRLYLDLWHGTCRQARFTTNDTTATFTITGPFTVWLQILQGTLDLFQALVRGHLTVEGDIRQVMAYAHAAQELVATANRLPTSFEDTP